MIISLERFIEELRKYPIDETNVEIKTNFLASYDATAGINTSTRVLSVEIHSVADHGVVIPGDRAAEVISIGSSETLVPKKENAPTGQPVNP